MSWYRNIVFMAKGLQEFTRSGYSRAAANFNASDTDVDCDGRHFMITGANSGIGLALAEAIATRGGVVHMVCRNGERANAAADEIRRKLAENGDSEDPSNSGDHRRTGAVHVHVVDLSRPRHVCRFAAEFASRPDARLHVLINNAGCMVHADTADGDATARRPVTADGLDVNTATNTLAVHVLTECLVPLLAKADGGDGRVIVVSSAGMLTHKLDVQQLRAHTSQSTDEALKSDGASYDGTAVYAQNKRQQVVMVERYAQRHPSVKFFSMHPGWADTPAVRQAMPQFYAQLAHRLRSPQQGADTALWLAVSAAVDTKHSGEFFQDRRPVSKHLPLAWTHSSAEQQTELMSVLDELYTLYSTGHDDEEK